ncbi:MAG: phosphonopyruvate decarboxylase [Bacteroidetes bacterium]|nr:phosphonopyruvate decarboxylase [Bacteroidota bacterium]
MSIHPQEFYDVLLDNGISFFTGVPDSLLKEFCLCIDANTLKERHIIAANEGNAIALAAGYYLSTGKIPLVYMQNSGFGNAVNPLLSLCDPEVYAIPILLLIGWRGEPGVEDEPQHIKQGKVQIELLNSMNIPYSVIPDEKENIEKKIYRLVNLASKEKQPVALLARKGIFAKYGEVSSKSSDLSMMREDALKIILNMLTDNCIIISTTGKTSREVFEIREKNGESHEKDFLIIGSMGHCSSVALGIALTRPKQKVICIDGDGALIMHMGSLATVGKLKPTNFRHILFNNMVHESVGGQETAAGYIDIPGLVKMNGYNNIFSIRDKDQLIDQFDNFLTNKGPNFLEIKVKAGSRRDLGRPTIKPIDIKTDFMEFITRWK